MLTLDFGRFWKMTGRPTCGKKGIRQTKQAVGQMHCGLLLQKAVIPFGENRRWQARPIEKVKVVIVKDSKSLG